MKIRSKIRRKDGIIISVIVALILCSVVFVAHAQLFTNRSVDLDDLAFSELNNANENHREYISRLIQEEYGAIHSLALYFEEKEDFDFRNELDLINSIMLADHYGFIGYANLDGSIIAHDGTVRPNVADKQWFQEAASWKGYDSIEVLPPDEEHSRPHIHIASPVRKCNNLTGILCACIDADDFNATLTAGYFDQKEAVFITDSAGNILLSNKNAGSHVFGSNLFDFVTDGTLLDGVSAEHILTNLQKGNNGQFRVNHGELEYLVYSPLGINDWMLFSMIPSSVANVQFSAYVDQAENITWIFSIAFLTAIAIVCIMLVFYIRQNRKILLIHEQKETAHKNILTALDSVMYDYDVITQEFLVPDGFAEMFGCSLPKDIFQSSEWTSQHPEFDDKALQQCFITVGMNKRQGEVTLKLQSDSKGLIYMRITMIPRINNDGRVIGIHGMIADVTESYTKDLYLRQNHDSAVVIISALAPMALSANLTQNTHHIISYNHFDLSCVLEEGSYDDLIRHGAEHIHEDDRDAFLSAFSRENLLAEFAAGHEIVDFPHRMINDSGMLRWYIGRCVMVRSQTDNDIHMAMVLLDNTQQMEQQRKLQKQYELTIENLPSFTAKWVFKNGDMYLLDANRRYLDFMGGSADELFNKSVIYGFGKQDKAALLSRLYASVRKRDSISLTHSVVTYDGKSRFLDIQASYFEEVDGNPVYFGVLTDVTELVMTEERLKQIETSLHTTVDHFIHTILEYNIETRAMRLVSGGDSRIDIESAIRSCPESLFQSGVFEAESLDVIHQFFGELEDGRNSGPLPMTVCCKDGTRLFVETTGTIIHNPKGAPTSALVILTKTGEIEGADETSSEQASASGETADSHKAFARTFGSFDLFLHDKPLYFTSAKAKELLAILVDRRGGTLSASEAISLLWENEPAGDKQLNRYRKLATRLKETLESVGCGDILINDKGVRSIDITKLSCDYFLAVDGDEAAQKLYQGFYMSGYSWAEERNAALNRMFGVDSSDEQIK